MLTFATRKIRILIKIDQHTFDVFITSDQLQKRIGVLAAQIAEQYHNESVYLLVILGGAYRFAADLSANLPIEVEVGFAKLASYNGLERLNEVSITLFPALEELRGKTVILVEDIVDTGHTLAYLLSLPQLQVAKELKIASLLFKPDAYKHNFKIDYLGFEIPNYFVLGYGLDYNGLGRNLNDIYQLKDE